MTEQTTSPSSTVACPPCGPAVTPPPASTPAREPGAATTDETLDWSAAARRLRDRHLAEWSEPYNTERRRRGLPAIRKAGP